MLRIASMQRRVECAVFHAKHVLEALMNRLGNAALANSWPEGSR
jgi:hypothetical protein